MSSSTARPALARGDRPRPRLDRTTLERDGEVLCGLLVAGCFAVAARYWPTLPARVPMHFDAAGGVDGWGPRGSVWVVPVVAAVLYGVLTLLGRIPHVYNYPWPITAENAERQYRLARRCLAAVKLVMMVSFLGITLAICRAAVGKAGMPPWLLPGLLAALAVVIVTYVVAASRAR
jgi:uncharacterized membrane protein